MLHVYSVEIFKKKSTLRHIEKYRIIWYSRQHGCIFGSTRMVLKKCNVRVLVFIALATGLLGHPFFVFAQTNGVDYENIISDNELIAYQTMSALTIQQFLENRSSYLKSFMVSPDDGSGPILASQYIYNISQKHRVNPR